MNRFLMENHMRRALELAAKAEGQTYPNPMVGALVIQGGKVIAEGYHRRAGLPHAEIVALKKAGSRARGATLVVSLEPCCHVGRTSPCTDAILKSGVREVVVGMRDPNPRVAGKGIRILQRNGVKVARDVLRPECERLNEVFVKYITTGFPFVTLKSALSLDGKIATAAGESRWITSAPARRYVHHLRHTCSAILVGAGTVVMDNPRLTARPEKKTGGHPARVILDNQNRVPLGARVFHNSRTQRVIYVMSPEGPEEKEQVLVARGVEVIRIREKGGGIDLRRLFRTLARMELTSILIEGGGQVNASVLEAGLVDKVVFFLAPLIIGGKEAPGPVMGAGVRRLRQALKLKNVKWTPIGSDWMVEGGL